MPLVWRLATVVGYCKIGKWQGLVEGDSLVYKEPPSMNAWGWFHLDLDLQFWRKRLERFGVTNGVVDRVVVVRSFDQVLERGVRVAL